MDIVENIRQFLLHNTPKQALLEFYFVPPDVILDISVELSNVLYGAMMSEEESWDGSDLNMHISI